MRQTLFQSFSSLGSSKPAVGYSSLLSKHTVEIPTIQSHCRISTKIFKFDNIKADFGTPLVSFVQSCSISCLTCLLTLVVQLRTHLFYKRWINKMLQCYRWNNRLVHVCRPFFLIWRGLSSAEKVHEAWLIPNISRKFLQANVLFLTWIESAIENQFHGTLFIPNFFRL